MSFPRDGRAMDRPPAAGSITRARQRAEAGLQPENPLQGLRLPRAMEDYESQIAQPSVNFRRPPAGPSAAGPPSNLPRPPPPTGLPPRPGQNGIAISRPTQIPQWPLAGPIASQASLSDSEPYQPPPGRSQPPPRPARPSRVPSILDGSKIQDHTPVFQYQPQPNRELPGQDQLLAIPETPDAYSQRSTVSSVGSIPDFPVPAQLQVAGSRRSVTLGPPPSARRGASSFYSTVSYVSPIPEESPRTRSHTSFASSAAMPESWQSASPGPSPHFPDGPPPFEDPITEEGNPFEDDAEEVQLVRSASMGKRGKPVLVTTSASRDGAETEDPSGKRPDPMPLQSDAFTGGAGYVEATTSSSGTLPTVRTLAPAQAITRDSFIEAYNAASATDPSNPPRSTPSPQPPTSRPYSRLSAIRRPPKLDIGAVKKAEARGSLTSLPDLIRRATRLAASLEEGKRPASRFDNLNDFGRFADEGERKFSYDGEKHQSGFSDMLAAFPAPTQQTSGHRSLRESFRQQAGSWPLPLMNRGQSRNTFRAEESLDSDEKRKKGRRCCGLPRWGFILVTFLLLALVAAAIVVPLEFLVFRKNRGAAGGTAPALQDCQAQLTCQNGGTNVVMQGVCSCICTNGFTGSDCSAPSANGCTTTSLAGDTNINNVTLGEAIPRLIQQAQTNFSIPLSPTTILAKLNAGGLSCAAENALVTFDGQSTRLGDASQEVIAPNELANAFALEEAAPIPTAVAAAVNNLNVAEGGFSTVITAPGSFTTSFTISFPITTPAPSPTQPPEIDPNPPGNPDLPTVTTTVTSSSSSSSSSPTRSASPSGTANPAQTLAVTEELLDFARVAVLRILQEDSLKEAESAQNALQRVFSLVSQGKTDASKVVTVGQASNVTLAGGNSVDLVNFRVDTGGNLVGGRRVAAL